MFHFFELEHEQARRKKMSNFQLKIEGATTLNYRPAQLYRNSQGWYIEYSTLSQEQNKLQRNRIRLNRLQRQSASMVDFRMKAESLVESINIQLHYHYDSVQTAPTVLTPSAQLMQQMYVSLPSNMPMPVAVPLSSASAAVSEPITPAAEIEQPLAVSEPQSKRLHKSVAEVAEAFLKEKADELKEGTLRSYKACCKQICTWVEQEYPNMAMSQFTPELAVEYLDFVNGGGNSNGKKQVRKKIDENRVSPRTYNNNIKMARAFFSWAVEKCYCKVNPFSNMKKKREQPKQRTIIPPKDRARIYAYFKEHNPAMCLIIEMVYTSLIRPIEITRIQVKDIDFAHHCIHLPADKTKNMQARDSRIDSHLQAALMEHVKHANANDYLFADKTWQCGVCPMERKTFTHQWIKMRDELQLPKEYQLYSLRDTGINEMLEQGIPALDVMQAAGHSDLAMTTRYANHKNPELINKLNSHAPGFIIQKQDM